MIIKIVTPVFNGVRFLKKTFDSIIQQANTDCTIHYHVQDGGSKDGVIEFCRNYAPKFQEVGIYFTYHSKADRGMYHAISHGFRSFSIIADICCYINAGDYFAPRCFSNLKQLFEDSDIKWITGINVKYNTKGDIIGARLPGIYPQTMIRSGVFGSLLPCIQQESTFWREELNSTIDFERLSNFRLAGDYYLWHCFSGSTKLKVASVWLSGFTVEPGQLSEIHRDKYSVELRSVATKSVLDYVLSIPVGIHWLLPDSIKKQASPSTYLSVQ